MASYYSFGRIPDAEVIRLGQALCEAFPTSQVTINLGDHSAFALGPDTEVPEPYSSLLNSDTFLVQNMAFNDQGTSSRLIYYRSKIRGLNHQHVETWLPSPSSFVDGIELTGPSTQPEVNGPTILKIVADRIGMAPPLTLVDGGQTALDQSAAILNGLSSAISTLVEHTAERQKNLDETRESLSEDAQETLKNLRAELEHEIDERNQKLDEREQYLEARAGKLDDRENVHVRREIQEKMAKLSDERLEKKLLSQSRTAFTFPVALASLAAAAVGWIMFREIGHIDALGGAISTLVRDETVAAAAKPDLISNINGQIIYAQIRIALQGIGLALLIWFALRMTSNRFKQVSQWERDLHKFRLDTERAGFLVEGDLEARKVNDNGLPDVLLESFSRGLFSTSDPGSAHDQKNEGVGDALNAMLAQAARVQVGPTGVSVEVDRRGLDRARRTIGRSEADA